MKHWLDGYTYFHLPTFGFIVSATLGFILNEVFDGEFYSRHIFRFLIAEKFNFHLTSDKMLDISPYFSLMGLDISEKAGLLCNGIGLNFRLLPKKCIRIGTSVGLQHYIDLNDTFDSKTNFGHLVGFNLNIIL